MTAGFIAGVPLGIGVGIALFLVDYSQVSTVRYVVNGREIRSNIDRSESAEQLLYERGRRINDVKLQGYLFLPARIKYWCSPKRSSIASVATAPIRSSSTSKGWRASIRRPPWRSCG